VTVYLVGAGPGDPGLITVRGAELLGRADIVVYDRLSASALLDLAPPRAELVNVGKTPGRVSRTQSEICALLVEHGRVGREVVRLKGGDPFVFARGGEEAQALLDAGVDFEIVPGVSAAIAAPAYAGVPVTMRYSSTSFTVVTGHEDPDKTAELDWDAVARVGGTIVVLMGVGRLEKITRRLLAAGLAPDTPVAAIRWGSRPSQQTVRATLATIADHVLEPPTTIVIGAVAALRLEWFERRPLFGRRVITTRAREQAGSMSSRLRELGAEPIEIPVIEVVDPADGGAALRKGLAALDSYDWLVVTSANGARRVLNELRDARDLGSVRVAAIGPGTAESLREGNIEADLVPERFVAESLLEAFPPPSSDDHGRVLLARAAVARDVLPDGLTRLGWDVEVVDAYQTVAAAVGEGHREAVAGADTVLFTSSSTVTRFVEAFGIEAVPPTVACIGPITAATAAGLGLRVDVVAGEHTVEGLLSELVRFVQSSPPSSPS
jgi:uroporphyrinogen III methyltransferase / synthase